MSQGGTGSSSIASGVVISNGSVLSSNNTTGLITQTSSGIITGRTITSGFGVTITNGNGVSGNPNIAVDQTSVFNNIYTNRLFNTPSIRKQPANQGSLNPSFTSYNVGPGFQQAPYYDDFTTGRRYSTKSPFSANTTSSQTNIGQLNWTPISSDGNPFYCEFEGDDPNRANCRGMYDITCGTFAAPPASTQICGLVLHGDYRSFPSVIPYPTFSLQGTTQPLRAVAFTSDTNGFGGAAWSVGLLGTEGTSVGLPSLTTIVGRTIILPTNQNAVFVASPRVGTGPRVYVYRNGVNVLDAAVLTPSGWNKIIIRATTISPSSNTWDFVFINTETNNFEINTYTFSNTLGSGVYVPFMYVASGTTAYFNIDKFEMWYAQDMNT